MVSFRLQSYFFIGRSLREAVALSPISGTGWNHLYRICKSVFPDSSSFIKKERDHPLRLFHNIAGILDVVCLLLWRKSQELSLPHSICLEFQILGPQRPFGKSWSMYPTISRVLSQILVCLCLFCFPLWPSRSLLYCQPLFKPQHSELSGEMWVLSSSHLGCMRLGGSMVVPWGHLFLILKGQ